MQEYNEVLRRKKFHFSENKVATFLGAIQKLGLLVNPKHTNEIIPDIKDLPFYEVVLDKQDKGAKLVTGNIKHFPNNPNIVTAREFLTILGA